jgi:8-oxo-dGTP pyrophosphatase MutT (NUDIX family)
VRASQPLPRHWLPLVLGRQPCGWVDPETARTLARAPSPFEIDGGRLSVAPDDLQACSRAMQFAAQRLHEVGIVRHWRSEQLDVRTDDGRTIATVERAACRALGVATRSVHLNAFRSDGSLLAARRAPHKLSDPDRWDNLVGGMIAAGERDLEALAREAYEEAGLQMAELQPVRGARLRVQRTVAEGLMIETIQVFDVQLPGDFVPVNVDGEVACFDTWPVASALDAIERGDFTLEAALATLDGLQRALFAGELR